MKGLFCIILLTLFATGTHAQDDVLSVSALKSWDTYKTYPDTATIPTRIYIGAAKKVSNQYDWEDVVKTASVTHRSIFALARDENLENELTKFVDQLESLGFASVFECEKRACGKSSLWASDVFEEPKLNGRDNQQYYGVFSRHLAGSGIDEWLVLYGSHRNSKSAYVALEIQRGENTLQGEPAQYDWLYGNDRQSLVKQLEGQLVNGAQTQVWIVSHAQDDNKLMSLKRSQKNGDQLKSLLLETYSLRSSQVTVVPMGTFADVSKDTSSWYEIHVENLPEEQ